MSAEGEFHGYIEGKRGKGSFKGKHNGKGFNGEGYKGDGKGKGYKGKGKAECYNCGQPGHIWTKDAQLELDSKHKRKRK